MPTLTKDDDGELLVPLEADKVICKLCRRQFAKYTCPTCNVPYCSLVCFRSQAHSQCSETFYRREVRSDIHTDASASAEERLRMMDLLKRFEEEQSVEEHDALLDDDSDDENGLAKRLHGIDLDAASPEQVWNALTPEERRKFAKALDEPSSELAQQLLASEVLDKERKEPWWTAPSTTATPQGSLSYGDQPKMMEVPSSLVKLVPGGPVLVYNLCALCIAYTYVSRHLATSPLSDLEPNDPDHSEARRLLLRLVPFLTDSKARVAHSSLAQVVTDLWSRFSEGQMTSSAFSVLLADASTLIHPASITQFADAPTTAPLMNASHPHRTTVLVLSDLTQLLSRTGPETKPNHVTHKLLFYAGHVLALPSDAMRALAHELLERAKTMKAEADKNAEIAESDERKQTLAKKVLIESVL